MCILCTPQPIHRSTYQSTLDRSVDISTETRPICRSTYRPILGHYNDRDMSVDLSTDVSTEISVESRSTYRPTIARYLGRYSGRHSADTLTTDCSAEYRPTVGGISVKSLDCQCQMYKLYTFHPFLVNLKNF